MCYHQAKTTVTEQLKEMENQGKVHLSVKENMSQAMVGVFITSREDKPSQPGIPLTAN